MRKTYKLFAVVFISALINSCAGKVLVMQAPIISMKQNNTGTVKSFSEGKPIEEKWCNSEDPVRNNNDGSKHYGMIDQVVWRAHENTHADFFVNNRFYQQGDCMWMNANIAESDGVHTPAASPMSERNKPAPHKAPAKKKSK